MANCGHTGLWPPKLHDSIDRSKPSGHGGDLISTGNLMDLIVFLKISPDLVVILSVQTEISPDLTAISLHLAEKPSYQRKTRKSNCSSLSDWFEFDFLAKTRWRLSHSPNRSISSWVPNPSGGSGLSSKLTALITHVSLILRYPMRIIRNTI